MRHVQACLIARDDQDSCFDHCRGPVMLVLAC